MWPSIWLVYSIKWELQLILFVLMTISNYNQFKRITYYILHTYTWLSFFQQNFFFWSIMMILWWLLFMRTLTLLSRNLTWYALYLWNWKLAAKSTKHGKGGIHKPCGQPWEVKIFFLKSTLFYKSFRAYPLNSWQVAPSVWRPTSELIFGQTFHIIGLKKKISLELLKKWTTFVL